MANFTHAGDVVNKAGYAHAIVDVDMCSAPPSIRAVICMSHGTWE
jgi:hypothetical protein